MTMANDLLFIERMPIRNRKFSEPGYNFYKYKSGNLTAMDNNQSMRLWLPSLFVLLFSFYAVNGQATGINYQFGYTHGSSTNLRNGRATYTEIAHKLPINTPVKILRKQGDWILVQVVDDESVQGWMHRILFYWQPLSLEKALERYHYAMENSPKRLKWIERAAAIAPRDTDVLEELVKTLQSRELHERANLVLKNLAELKANQSENMASSITSPETSIELSPQYQPANPNNTLAIELWNYFETMLKTLEIVGWNRPPYKITPHQISKIAGIPIFTSGPHKDRFVSDSHSEFGHYNPEFIAWAKKAVTPETEAYYKATAPLFDKYVRTRLHDMLAAYHFLRENPEFNTSLLQNYRESMASNQPFKEHGIWDKNPDLQELYVVFWLRRQIDGTAADVKEFFELVARIYDPRVLLLFKKFTICPCDNTTEPWPGVKK